MTEYKKTQTAEKDFIKNLQDKYGMGTLNIGDGQFVPTPQVTTPEKTENS